MSVATAEVNWDGEDDGESAEQHSHDRDREELTRR